MNKETKKSLNIVALVLLIFCLLLDATNGFNGFIAGKPYNNMMDFTAGLTMATLLMNILFLSGKLEVIRNWKKQLFRKN